MDSTKAALEGRGFKPNFFGEENKMKVWLISFGLLFVLAQFILWIKDIFLPLPIYVFAGAFLAIASNYERGIGSFLVHQTNTLPENQSDSDNK